MAPIVRKSLRVASFIVSRVTAPVEVRECLALQDWAGLLASALSPLREWARLITCHRFELYVVAESGEIEALVAQIEALLAKTIAPVVGSDIDATPWSVQMDDDAAEHLCRVAAGLDSLVLGEAQIQGQIISTYTDGLEAGTIGPVLSALFRSAIRVGKRVRSETAISTHAVSMSSLALSMAARYFPDFSQRRVLVIGAGEMSKLALKALLQRQVAEVTVANRTLARAEAVLMHPTWRALELGRLTDVVHDYDVIFSATSAVDFVLRADNFADRTDTGGAPKQVLIDLAVPRDIDPAVRDVPGVVLVDVDDLRQGIDQSLENRKQALPAVYAIIAEELARWQGEQRELSMRPFVVELRQRAEHIRQQEVERTMRFMGDVDADTRQRIQQLSHALVNKLLHEPTIRIKELAHTSEPDAYMSAICDLFGLDTVNLNHGLIVQSNSQDAKLRGEPSPR